MVPVLLKSKLCSPGIRIHSISREELIKKIDLGMQSRLTTICVPAGFGKSTLLSQWSHGSTIPTAWLSLDDMDNDIIRFWRYVVYALSSTCGSELSNRMMPLIQSYPSVSIYAIIDALINEFYSLKDNFVLILDDYQTISDEQIHTSLSYFIEYLPGHAHVYIASRIGLPFSTIKWEVRGELNAITLRDMQFTEEQTTAFYHQTTNLPLSTVQIKKLVKSTEGWVAGLQLVAISLQNHTNFDLYIDQYTTTTHSAISDYLLHEVIKGLPPDVYQFVLHTSILYRLDPATCNMLTKRSDSYQMLETIKKLNLFLIPLDTHNDSYRYHHLFSEFLRRQLSLDNPTFIHDLHRLASQSYAEHGMLDDAIEHAILAEDNPLIVSLLGQYVISALQNGELSTLIRWFESVPHPESTLTPLLSLLYAYALANNDQIERAVAQLNLVEQRLPGIQSSEERKELVGGIYMLRANILFSSGGLKEWFELSKQSTGQLPESKIFYNFNFNRSEPYVRRTIFGLKGMISTMTIAGTKKILEILQAHGWTDSLLYLFTAQGLAEGLYELNRLVESQEVLQQIEAPCRLKKIGGLLVPNRLVQAQIQLALGQPLLALDTIDEIIQTANNLSEFHWISPLRAFRARIYLRVENIAQAKQEMAFLRISPEDKPSINKELEYTTLACLLYKQTKYDSALRILELLKPAAIREKQLSSIVEINKLQALIHYNLENRLEAFTSLQEALTLGESNHYIRIFVDEGLPMKRLMQDYINERRLASDRVTWEETYLTYTTAILSAFPNNEIPNHAIQLAAIIDSMTPKELEIIRLIGEGYANKYIAAELGLTIGTVKVYLNRIYSKLGVKSRLQAAVKIQDIMS